MNSLKRIESKTIPRGSILIVESPDRVSRQRFSEAYPTYQCIQSAGIEIHFLSIRDVLKLEHSFTNILRVGVEIAPGELRKRAEERKGRGSLVKEAGNVQTAKRP